VETSRDGGADWVAIAHDQAVSALCDSERRFRGIPEGALDGIVTTDDNGVILNFIAAAEVPVELTVTSTWIASRAQFTGACPRSDAAEGGA